MSHQDDFPTLDCHEADNTERAAAFGNVYECWGDERPIDDYVAWRMQSVQHARATWYVGTVDGVVAASLGAYPIVLRAGDQGFAGYGIGAVHTRPEYRRRGYARTLFEWVERQQIAQGAEFGLLYSDIKPEYYGLMGYQLCESHYAWGLPRPGLTPGDPAATGRLEPFDPLEQAAPLASMYAEGQRGRSIWIERDEIYWEWVRGRYPDHEWLWWIPGSDDEPRGYAQLKHTESETRVFDWALRAESDAGAYWRSLVTMAAERGIARFGGWLPDHAALKSVLDVTPRIKELTMIKPLTDRAPWDEAYRDDADFFTECDHI